MTARIFLPAPSATQSAPEMSKPWILIFERETPRTIEPLMGWTSSSDMKSQIKLRFATKEEAIAYAEREGIPYRVENPRPDNAPRRTVSYSDNCRPNRIGLWTH